MELLEIATEVQRNNADEAIAIKGYTELLNAVAKSELESEDRQLIFDNITEIISDELNHSARLNMLYEKLTGIKENKQ